MVSPHLASYLLFTQEMIPSAWAKLTRVNEFLSERLKKNEEKAKKIGAQGSKTKELLRFLLDEEIGARLSGQDEPLGRWVGGRDCVILEAGRIVAGPGKVITLYSRDHFYPTSTSSYPPLPLSP